MRGLGTVFLMKGMGLHTAFTTEEEDVIWTISETSQEWTGDMTTWTKKETVDKQITEIRYHQSEVNREGVDMVLVRQFDQFTPFCHDDIDSCT
jgi:hypothetical protein